MFYFAGSRPLISQTAKITSKKKETIHEAVRRGAVRALCVYPFSGSTTESDTYFGPFKGNTQAGTAWDWDSKEWVPVSRRIVGVQIDDKFLSTPRAILRGLVEGYYTIGTDEFLKILKPLTGSPLESQSGVRTEKRSGASSGVPSGEKGTPSPIISTMYVDAGAGHLNRMRVRQTPVGDMSSFSMENTFYDVNTVKSDIRSLQVKYADAQRTHFGANAIRPIAWQTPGLTQLMREMKVSVPGPNGSFQEEIRQVPVGEDTDDVGA